MRKVLLLIDNLEGGGAERVFANLANGFVNKQVHVEILFGQKTGVYLDLLHPSIEVTAVGSTHFLQYLRAYRRVFATKNYTHVFTAGQYVSAAAILAKKVTGTKAKIIQTHHYSHPGKRPLRYLAGDLLLKLLYFTTAPSADSIVAVSKGSLQWLRKFSRRNLPQATVIYNPVFDEQIFQLAEQPLHTPGVGYKKPIIVNVGRLSEQKDQDTLVTAFHRLLITFPEAQLLIVGTGPLELELRRKIAVLGMEEQVFLVGFQQNPYNWIKACDLFVLSSRYEGFGNVIVEAMALGKTVVATDCPSGPAEILHNPALGYLCKVQDPDDMVRVMQQALWAPVDEEKVITESKQYQVSVIVEQYLRLL